LLADLEDFGVPNTSASFGSDLKGEKIRDDGEYDDNRPTEASTGIQGATGNSGSEASRTTSRSIALSSDDFILRWPSFDNAFGSGRSSKSQQLEGTGEFIIRLL
jgi:hypothetical protein